MNPKDMTIEQLKALAYDEIAILERAQQNLRNINAEIQLKSKPVSGPPITEVKG